MLCRSALLILPYIIRGIRSIRDIRVPLFLAFISFL